MLLCSWTLVDNAHLHSLRDIAANTELSERLTAWLAENLKSPFPNHTAQRKITLQTVVNRIKNNPERFIQVIHTLSTSKVWLLQANGCSSAGQLHDVMDLALAQALDKNMQAFVLFDAMDRASNLQSLTTLLNNAHLVSVAPSYLNFGEKVGFQESDSHNSYTLKQVLVECHVHSEQIASAARRLQQLLQGLPAFQLLGPVPDPILQAAFGHVARDICAREPAQTNKPAGRSRADAATDILYLSNMDSMDGSAQALRDCMHHGQLVPGLTQLPEELAVKINACFGRCADCVILEPDVWVLLGVIGAMPLHSTTFKNTCTRVPYDTQVETGDIWELV